MKLTGEEPWVVAGQQGATIWSREWGDKDFMWPIVDVELDTGLCKIDVCGMLETKHLDDFAQIRVNDEEPIDHGDYCAWQQEPADPALTKKP